MIICSPLESNDRREIFNMSLKSRHIYLGNSTCIPRKNSRKNNSKSESNYRLCFNYLHIYSIIPLLLRVFDSVAPTHFYGELAKTDLGCQVLQEKGHFLDFAHFVRQHALESDDLEIIFRLKSVLWAVVSILFGEMSFCITDKNIGKYCHRRRRSSFP